MGIWETIFGPLGVDFGHMRVNFGHMEVVFSPVNDEFQPCFLNLRPPGVIFDAYESSWELLESFVGL